MKFSVICSLLTLGLIFSGCSKDKKEKVARAGIDPQTQNQAPPQIEKSFEVKKTAQTATSTTKSEVKADTDLFIDNAHVVVKKSALGKEFLLSANILTQTPTPSFSALQSRVVSFILRDQKVYLIDVTKNNVVGAETNIPQTLLIAEFPILTETETSLEIDFNSGMRQIFVSGDWFVSDFMDGNAEYNLQAAQVYLSYLDEVTMNNSELFIKQVAQIYADGKPMPVEVRYQIKPYLPNPDFIPMKSPGFDKVGYFEANPLLLADGSSLVYATKWNEKKTIQFAISANTPQKYRELVKSALLYWNKSLGEKAIEVTQLEDKTITAPRFDLNIIQWVDWDNAGSAYADAHIDPRSGEVTSAQIFFPSGFTKQNMAARVRATQGSRPMIGLKGFKSARLCERNLVNDLAQREMSEEVSPAAMDKAIRDYVYEVIAHELGHVLGLRHNFAGNLAANYDFKDRKNLIISYYKNMKAPEGVVSSSSVMEYSLFEESAWNGDRFQNGSKALAYDEMAIKHLYFKTALPTTNRPIFCTDSHVGLYADCNRHDAGRSIVSAASGAYQASLNSLAANLINAYIMNSKVGFDKATDLIPVSEVYLNASFSAKRIAQNLVKLVSLMKDGTQFLAVRSLYMPVLNTMKSEIEKSEKDYLQNEFTRLGGIETLTKEISENFDTDLVLKFSELLDDPMFNSGVLDDGSKFSFTADEKEIMKKQVALYAPQIKEQLILNEIKALSGQSANNEEKFSWADSDLTHEFSDILAKRFIHYSLSKTSEKLISEIPMKDGTKKSVELPVYKYAQNIRLASTGLLLSKYRAADGGFIGKQNAIKLLNEDLLPLGDATKIDIFVLDRNVLQWTLNNKKLLSIFLPSPQQ